MCMSIRLSDSLVNNVLAFFLQWHNSPQQVKASSLWRLHDQTQTHHRQQDSFGRLISPSQSPLPDINTPEGFKPAFATSERPQTHALERAATGVGCTGKVMLHRDVYVDVLDCLCVNVYCTVLYCTVLYSTVLYCTVLYCTVLYCTVLYCTVLYCTVLLPPGGNPIAVNKYIISYTSQHITSHIISHHIISHNIISQHSISHHKRRVCNCAGQHDEQKFLNS